MWRCFPCTSRPTSITTHLSTFDNTEELARTTKCLVQGKYETDAHDSLTHAHRTLKIQVASDSALEKNAQVLGLATVTTRGDGNCLQYSVNESHRQQTGKYIADNDNLRLLATALTRAHTQKKPTSRSSAPTAEHTTLLTFDFWSSFIILSTHIRMLRVNRTLLHIQQEQSKNKTILLAASWQFSGWRHA